MVGSSELFGKYKNPTVFVVEVNGQQWSVSENYVNMITQRVETGMG